MFSSHEVKIYWSLMRVFVCLLVSYQFVRLLDGSLGFHLRCGANCWKHSKKNQGESIIKLHLNRYHELIRYALLLTLLGDKSGLRSVILAGWQFIGDWTWLFLRNRVFLTLKWKIVVLKQKNMLNTPRELESGIQVTMIQ